MASTTRRGYPFPLSKCLDPRDLEGELVPEVARVLEVDALANQHPMRLWEYAMAHRAIAEWDRTQQQADGYGGVQRIADVGGAGSGFWRSLSGYTTQPIVLIDPAVADGTLVDTHGGREYRAETWRTTVEEYAAHAPHDQFDVICSLSVLEHLAEPRPFLRACRMLLRPGGLLFLTMDTWNCSGADTAHFHWMRKRIYNPDLIRRLQEDLREMRYASFGRGDWTYHGDHVHNYAFASLAMTKKLSHA